MNLAQHCSWEPMMGVSRLSVRRPRGNRRRGCRSGCRSARDGLYSFESQFSGLVQPVFSHPGIVVAETSTWAHRMHISDMPRMPCVNSMTVCESEEYTPFPAREIATGKCDNSKGLVYLSKYPWIVFINSFMPMRIYDKISGIHSREIHHAGTRIPVLVLVYRVLP